MAWKYSSPAGATQPAVVPQHPLPPPAPIAAPAAPVLQQATVLPPVQSPPPAQPVAEAPAPSGRRRRGASQVAAAQPAVQPAPVAQSGVVMQPTPVAAPAQLSIPGGGWLTMFSLPPGSTPGPSALTAVAEVAEIKGGEPNLFPTIELSGGSTGGMFDYDEMNEEGTDDDLPTGRKAFVGVLLAYRFAIIAWPAGYQKGVKRQPAWQATLSMNRAQEVSIATEAFKQYTMRQRPAVQGGAEPRYDIPGGSGHPQMAIEALVFEPKVGLMVVRSCWTYESMTSTTTSMGLAFPKQLGADGKEYPVVSPTPVTINPHSFKTKGSKKQPDGWDEHAIVFTAPTLPLSAEIQQVAAIFQQFYAQAAQDAELKDMLNEWMGHTLTPEQAQALQQIAVRQAATAQ